MCRKSDRYDEPDSSCRRFNNNHHTKIIDDCSPNVEGLECIVLPPSKPQRFNVTKRNIGEPPPTEEGSSGGSNNELSTLLPPAPFLSAFLAPRRDFPLSICYLPPMDGVKFTSPQRGRLKRSRINRRRSCHNHRTKRDTAIASSLSAGHGKHCARSFNDTTDGSVHCFMDEHGNWVTYTFDEKGLGEFLLIICSFKVVFCEKIVK